MAKDTRLPAQTTRRHDKKKWHYQIAAILILFLGVVFSLSIWQVTRKAVHKAEQSRFDHYAEMIGTLLKERVNEHIAALRGLRAFIDSSEKVTRVEWQTFVDDLEIDRHFKGCLGFSFIRYVARQDLEQFLAETRADNDPDFSIVSSGNNPALFVVEMVQPLERNRSFVGYDLAQESFFSETLRKAANFDHAVLSNASSIVQDVEGRSGVLLLLPVYKKVARDALDAQNSKVLRGWVGASIMVGDMVSGVGDSFHSLLDIEVLDLSQGKVPSVIYDSDGRLHSFEHASQDGAFGYEMVSRKTIDVVDRTWSLNVFALPGFAGMVEHYMPEALLLAGLLLSLISSRQVASYGKPLVRAQLLAEEMTRELRASEERFHKMFQEHNAVMLLVDPATQEIVDANEAACTYYGYTREQIIAMPIVRINSLPVHETRDAMQQVKERRRKHFEFKHALASGDLRDVEVYSSPIIIEGYPLLFSIIHDITERKLAEQELVNYRENLEALVEKQTDKLKEAHTELLQQERLATLGKLTATVSHELRNPLGTIKTALFYIGHNLERSERQVVLRPLELAERSIDRCITIIEELNSYTRVKKLKLSETVLDDWLKEVCDEQIIPKEIQCELCLFCGIKVSFDQEKLRQVVVNLISNAIHALQAEGSKGRLLQISTHCLEDFFEIRVRDNGIGMSDEIKEMVFEPLYSTKGFGVGLGMVIVKNIVEQHHGAIVIESKSGVGTTVCIRLPLVLAEVGRQPSP